MSKFLTGIAAIGLLGLAAMPVTATAAEQQSGVTNNGSTVQLTDVSAQRRHWRHHRYGYYGPRRHWGPRYGYYRPYPYYGAYGYPYGYYRPGPFVSFGAGPFGFRFF